MIWVMHAYALVADLFFFSQYILISIHGFSWSILSMIAQLINLFHQFIQALILINLVTSALITVLNIFVPYHLLSIHTHTHKCVSSVYTLFSLLLVIYIYLFMYVPCHIICSLSMNKYSCVSLCLCFTVYARLSWLLVSISICPIIYMSCHATCSLSKHMNNYVPSCLFSMDLTLSVMTHFCYIHFPYLMIHYSTFAYVCMCALTYKMTPGLLVQSDGPRVCIYNHY